MRTGQVELQSQEGNPILSGKTTVRSSQALPFRQTPDPSLFDQLLQDQLAPEQEKTAVRQQAIDRSGFGQQERFASLNSRYIGTLTGPTDPIPAKSRTLARNSLEIGGDVSEGTSKGVTSRRRSQETPSSKVTSDKVEQSRRQLDPQPLSASSPEQRSDLNHSEHIPPDSIVTSAHNGQLPQTTVLSQNVEQQVSLSESIVVAAESVKVITVAIPVTEPPEVLVSSKMKRSAPTPADQRQLGSAPVQTTPYRKGASHSRSRSVAEPQRQTVTSARGVMVSEPVVAPSEPVEVIEAAAVAPSIPVGHGVDVVPPAVAASLRELATAAKSETPRAVEPSYQPSSAAELMVEDHTGVLVVSAEPPKIAAAALMTDTLAAPVSTKVVGGEVPAEMVPPAASAPSRSVAPESRPQPVVEPQRPAATLTPVVPSAVSVEVVAAAQPSPTAELVMEKHDDAPVASAEPVKIVAVAPLVNKSTTPVAAKVVGVAEAPVVTLQEVVPPFASDLSRSSVQTTQPQSVTEPQRPSVAASEPVVSPPEPVEAVAVALSVEHSVDVAEPAMIASPRELATAAKSETVKVVESSHQPLPAAELMVEDHIGVPVASAEPARIAATAPETDMPAAPVTAKVAGVADAPVAIRQEVAPPAESDLSRTAEPDSWPQPVADLQRQIAIPTPVTAVSEPVVLPPEPVEAVALAPPVEHSVDVAEPALTASKREITTTAKSETVKVVEPPHQPPPAAEVTTVKPEASVEPVKGVSAAPVAAKVVGVTEAPFVAQQERPHPAASAPFRSVDQESRPQPAAEPQRPTAAVNEPIVKSPEPVEAVAVAPPVELSVDIAEPALVASPRELTAPAKRETLMVVEPALQPSPAAEVTTVEPAGKAVALAERVKIATAAPVADTPAAPVAAKVAGVAEAPVVARQELAPPAASDLSRAVAPETWPQFVAEQQRPAATPTPIVTVSEPEVSFEEPVDTLAVALPVGHCIDVAEPALVASPRELAAPAKSETLKVVEPTLQPSPAADVVTEEHAGAPVVSAEPVKIAAAVPNADTPAAPVTAKVAVVAEAPVAARQELAPPAASVLSRSVAPETWPQPVAEPQRPPATLTRDAAARELTGSSPEPVEVVEAVEAVATNTPVGQSIGVAESALSASPRELAAPAKSETLKVVEPKLQPSPAAKVTVIEPAGAAVASTEPVKIATAVPMVDTPVTPVVAKVAGIAEAPIAARQELARPAESGLSHSAAPETRPQPVAEPQRPAAKPTPIATVSEPVVSFEEPVDVLAVAPPVGHNIDVAEPALVAFPREFSAPPKSETLKVVEPILQPSPAAEVTAIEHASAAVASAESLKIAIADPNADMPAVPVAAKVAVVAEAPVAARQELEPPAASELSRAVAPETWPQPIAEPQSSAATPKPIATVSEPVVSFEEPVDALAVAPLVGHNIDVAESALVACPRELAAQAKSETHKVVESTLQPSPAADVVTEEHAGAPVVSAEPVKIAAAVPVVDTPVTPVVAKVAGVAEAPVAARQELAHLAASDLTRAVAPETRPQPVAEPQHSAAPPTRDVAVSEPVVLFEEPVEAVAVAPPVEHSVDVAEPVLVASPRELAAPAKSETFKAAEVTTVEPAGAAVASAEPVKVVAAAPVADTPAAPVAAKVAEVAETPVAIRQEMVPPEASATSQTAKQESFSTVISDRPDSKLTGFTTEISEELMLKTIPDPLTSSINGTLTAQESTNVLYSVEESIPIMQKPVIAASARIPRHWTPDGDDNGELAHIQRTGVSDGKMTSSKMDVIFSNSSSGDDSASDSNDKSGHQGQEKGREHVQAFTMTSHHTPETREPVPIAASGREDEVKNMLKDSILSQVKHAEIRHDVKGNGLISIRLSPEDLGELTINVRVEEHRLKVEVITENRTVREALMSNMESLKETLLKQHFTMERFDVSTGAGSRNSNQAFQEEAGAQRDGAFRQFVQKVELTDNSAPKSGDTGEERESSLVDLML